MVDESRIEILPPDRFFAIEAFYKNHWCPVMVGQGLRVTAPDGFSASRLILQIEHIHKTKGKVCPQLRKRLLSLQETKDVKQQLKRAGQKQVGFGVDDKTVITPKLGITYKR